ncbi:MAG: hypothetical protein R2911_01295 [Caldilineaceae bacterium]
MAQNDSYTTNQDTPLTVDAAHGLLANDSDPDGDQADHRLDYSGSIRAANWRSTQMDRLSTHPRLALWAPIPSPIRPVTASPLSNPATVAAFKSSKTQPDNPTATITIALDVQPDSKTNFNFGGSLGVFKLDDITPPDSDAYSSSKSFTVPPGTYTVAEQLVNGYLDANISCNPPAATLADLAQHQIVINAAAGANLTCTFVVQGAGQIIANKYNDRNHNHQRNSRDEWLNGWQMQVHSPYTSLTATQATAG